MLLNGRPLTGMQTVLSLWAVLLLLLFAFSSSGELVQVLALWRHGDRAPVRLPYPNDQYNESYWPRGWQQLTNVSA